MADFSTWYHGTSRDRAQLIVANGLDARKYGTDLDGADGAFHVLARERHQATGWAHTGTGSIVTVQVPDHERAEYLTCPDGPCYCGGVVSGLFKPLPPRMIRSAEDV